jgi:multidrug efflux pump
VLTLYTTPVIYLFMERARVFFTGPSPDAPRPGPGVNLSGPFVRRPVATVLLALAVLLAGLAAYYQLPVAPLPRVDFPTISVSASLPGASPEIMASAVATPLERRLGRIPGVTEMTSSSSLGSTNVTLQFDLDRNVADAARDVQAAINASLGELPPGLPNRPSFRNFNPSDAPVMIVSLTSDELPLPGSSTRPTRCSRSASRASTASDR